MHPDDRKQLKSGEFDRHSWNALWDRMSARQRPRAAKYVFEMLHATESGGRWSMSWTYETNIEREESGAPIYEDTQPGDIITFKGSAGGTVERASIRMPLECFAASGSAENARE